MLQDWSEEIQEYLEQANADSEAGYSFGNYGRAPAKVVTEAPKGAEVVSVDGGATDDEQHAGLNQTGKEPIIAPYVVTSSSSWSSKRKIPMPIPSPARPGETVLPHTELSDKSKRLLIVTTASLPWRTGTAVNPLLRAAYLTKDRKQAGGSVTLLLPWLERKEDQDRVYGINNGFATPDDQEEYIRTWLRESANMEQASVDLNIQWYTAWQNRVENSHLQHG